MIDPKLWADEHFGTLSDKAKILFVSCISNADDDGRLSGHTSNLRALAFRFDDISLNKIQEIRDEIQEKMKNFQVYSVNSCEYIQLLKWTDHQSIRSDRHIDSVLPGIDQATTKCQPSDNQMSHKVKESKVKESKVKESKVNTLVDCIFSYFCEKANRKLTLSTDRKKILHDRVKEGATLEDMKKAVDNFMHDDWPDRHKYLDIVYCFGIRNKINNYEKWRDKDVKSGRASFIRD